MGVLGLLVYSFAGGIIWLFNVEAAAIALGARGGWHWFEVGLTCATGQGLAYVFLFFFGDGLFKRWGWARRKVDQTQERYGKKMQTSFLALTAPAALVGIPPMTVMAALAGGFRVRLAPMIAIAFSLRLLRHCVLAAAGTQLMSWWSSLW